MSKQEEQGEQQDIYAAWASDGWTWRAAQDAWATWLDTLVESKGQEYMTTPEQLSEERERGAHWLYDLIWATLLSNVPSPVVAPWEILEESDREMFRHLWDTINKGFAARSK